MPAGLFRQRRPELAEDAYLRSKPSWVLAAIATTAAASVLGLWRSGRLSRIAATSLSRS